MSTSEQYEKQEKQEKEEKESEEKWERDPLSAVVWACILIWAGLVLLAGNLGLLTRFQVEAWPLILSGAGLIMLLEAFARLLVPAYRRAVTGTIIFGLILLGIGLGQITGLEITWPLVLIGIGLGLLLRGVIGGL
jgi:hypothetical protein